MSEIKNHDTIEETTCPPDAARVMDGLRDTGYDFNTAIADIVDNSIAANATKVDVNIILAPDQSVTVFIADNGCGMGHNELNNAMRYGSDKRPDAASLGKFGLGLKTASTAFCRCLSVVSRDTGSDSVLKAQWDLDYIAQKNNWLLRWPQVSEDEMDMLDAVADGSHGTLVIWEKVDRLMRQYSSAGYAANALKRIEDSLRFHLGMTFQMFLDHNCERAPNVDITLNGSPVAYWDPFGQKIAGTDLLVVDNIEIELPDGTTANLELKAYVLPNTNGFENKEDEVYARISNDRQGFYVYRENRLIHSGSWLGMFTREPHYSLLRVYLSFDHKLDDFLNVDIKKSRILMDDNLYNYIRNAIVAPRREANTRYRDGMKKSVAKQGQDAHFQSNNNIDNKASSVEASKVKITDAATNTVEVTNSQGTFKHTLSIRTSNKPGQYRVIPVPSIDDGLLWKPCMTDGKKGVELNQSHAYYLKVYQPVLDKANLVTGMDALLWALAEAELSTINDEVKEQYEDMRIHVSRCLRKLVADLPDPDLEEE